MDLTICYTNGAIAHIWQAGIQKYTQKRRGYIKRSKKNENETIPAARPGQNVKGKQQ